MKKDKNLIASKPMLSAVISWVVLRTSVSGFEVDDYESTYSIASFETLDEAEKYIREFQMTVYDVRISIVRGREK